MPEVKAFTAKAEGLANQLRSDCGVSAPFNPLSSGSNPPIQQFNALWDTGATKTVITKRVVDALGLMPSGKSKVRHANGESIVNVYHINIFLPNQVAFQFIPVTEGILGDTDVLIGMDIIGAGDFAISNYNGKTSFTFRVPSIGVIDFVADSRMKPQKSYTFNTETRRSVLKGAKIGRNEPCHCGSGKKYKHCCGNPAKK